MNRFCYRNKYSEETNKNMMNGNNPEYPIYSINEITKRTFQLVIAAIVVGFLIFTYYCFLGLYHTADMVAVFCCCLSIILYVRYRKIIKDIKFPVTAFISLSLIVFALKEGYETGQYLYYFPLIISIPIIVDDQKVYLKKIVFYYSLIIVSYLVCIIVGTNHQPWEPLQAAEQYKVFYANAISAIILTICFTYININLERKYLKELVEQKNRAVVSRTNFLSTMGHELRTPLNGIIGAINLLKRGETLPEQQEYIDILRFCADHMLHQVNDILDFNKIEAGKLEIHPTEVNLRGLMMSAITPFSNLFKEKGIDFKVEIDTELDSIVLADDVRLIQILNNLLSNALKFTQKGFVKLKVKTLSKNNGFLRARFWVEDTGTGIAEKDQKRIFDTFSQVYDKTTRNQKGSGLGLNICVELLKLMNSNLELKSEKGAGSIFSFDINFNYVDYQLLEEENFSDDKLDLSGIKILLAEDNQINMIIAVKMLTDLKANCIKAFNGEEVIVLLEKNADVDIILMDLEMPVMDGYTAVKQIKQKWPHIPVLAFTATMVDVEMLDKLKAFGFTDCVLKPFQAAVLLSQIKKYALVS